ncbi:MAG: OadG family protein [Planctomycetota bacterium]|jgi:Na+-transporting methylmalonyl-CoA/oxaloacetate decarboxylase gamma subunit|nr:OadG family protein [Planctomycetota bacterium]MDP7252202.1 OadG family protein [Planctomycetota bacterium]
MSGWIFFAESATQAISGFRNVSEQNGISISIVGMLLVFIVLSLITALLTALPHVVEKLNEIYPPSQEHHAPVQTSANDEEDAVLAAIGFVLHTQMARTRD